MKAGGRDVHRLCTAMTRESRICVTEDEKNRLKTIREEIYDSEEVPLAVALNQLMDGFAEESEGSSKRQD
jgi:hypothetical protein